MRARPGLTGGESLIGAFQADPAAQRVDLDDAHLEPVPEADRMATGRIDQPDLGVVEHELAPPLPRSGKKPS